MAEMEFVSCNSGVEVNNQVKALVCLLTLHPKGTINFPPFAELQSRHTLSVSPTIATSPSASPLAAPYRSWQPAPAASIADCSALCKSGRFLEHSHESQIVMTLRLQAPLTIFESLPDTNRSLPPREHESP